MNHEEIKPGQHRWVNGDGEVVASIDSSARIWSTAEPLNWGKSYEIYEPPKYVGGYRFGGAIGTQFNGTKKPYCFHRTMVKLVLGWEWVDL